VFLEVIKIGHILPCLADPEKIRFIAYFEKNVAEVFPYLNKILDGAIYNHEGKTLTIKREGRLITLHPIKIAAGKVIDEDDAHQIISWIKERINYCYENRNSIEPSFERRQKLSALDIYKLLPGTNCGRCEELTCIAFALKLSEEEIGVLKCADLFSGKFTEKKNELLRLLEASGYDVPKAFIPDEITKKEV
jgi:ArsR family metal-binding transcriptional regulator